LEVNSLIVGILEVDSLIVSNLRVDSLIVGILEVGIRTKHQWMIEKSSLFSMATPGNRRKISSPLDHLQ
jgi:hypothetical protein